MELRFSGLVPLSTGLTVGIVYAVAMASGTRGWPPTRDARDRWSNGDRTLSGNLWWKLPALGLLYIVLFLTAGSLILPYIRSSQGIASAS